MARVLWIHAKPVLGGHGGAELRTRTLVAEVVAAGHEVLLTQQQTQTVHTRIAGLRRLDLAFRQDRLRYLEKLRSPRPLCAPAVRGPDLLRARGTVDQFEPEISIVSELVSLDLARRLMPRGKPWIYEAHNVEPALFADLAAAARSPLRRIAFAVDGRRFARDQAAAVESADAVIAVSADDLAAIAAEGRPSRRVVVPSSVPSQRPARPAAAPPIVLFVGMLSYLPNVEAVYDLLRDVMPAVRQEVPDARLLVAGRDPRPALRREAARHSWCDLRENVADLGPVYRSARCVAIPLRTGSGSRLKSYEAMSYGVPIVGSPLAFSGIPVADGGTGYVAHSKPEMAERVLHLLRHPEDAARTGAASREQFERHLAPSVAAAPLLDLLDALAARRIESLR